MAKQSLPLNREELAWAAGFFDGEGHARKTPRGALSLAVSQADSPELLDRLVRALGVGVVYGPYTHKGRPKQRPFFVFNALGFEAAQHCACLLWPWLGSVKRAQIRRALVQWTDRPRKYFKTMRGSRLVCRRGHRVEGANAYMAKSGHTVCRECRRIGERERGGSASVTPYSP